MPGKLASITCNAHGSDSFEEQGAVAAVAVGELVGRPRHHPGTGPGPASTSRPRSSAPTAVQGYKIIFEFLILN